MSDEATRKKKLGQIQALLDKADSTTFSDEADACRRKADDLMLSYSISEFEINQRKPKTLQEDPILRRYPIDTTGPFMESIYELAFVTSRHAGCKGVSTGRGKPGGYMSIVGFPADLDYFEMLFTSLRLQMSGELEPKPDPSLTEEENIKLLKEAGLKWERIYALMRPGQPWQRSACVRWGAMYTRYCEENGLPRNYSSPSIYQRSFAEGYVTKVSNRLYDIREAQKIEQVGGSGMEVAMRDKGQQINDALSDFFPKLGSYKQKRTKYDVAAGNRGVAAAERADLGQTRVGARKEIG